MVQIFLNMFFGTILILCASIFIYYFNSNTNTVEYHLIKNDSILEEKAYLKCRSIKGLILLTHSTPSYMLDIGVKLANTGCYYVIVADSCINDSSNNNTFSHIYEYNYTTTDPSQYKTVVKGIEKITNVQIYDASSMNRLYNRIHQIIIDLKVPFLGAVINSIGNVVCI